MANAAAVRAWMQEHGRSQVRGNLPKTIISEWDAAHPDDPYEPGTPRGAGFITDEEMEDLFRDDDPPDGQDSVAETRPRRPGKPPGRAPAKNAGGLPGFFSRGTSKGKAAKKKPPRVSTESLLGSAWRGMAKLATPLPPLYRTLRVQSPVAGILLEDAVRDTAADAVLQPFARLSEAGKTVGALIGPPLFVTLMSVHMMQCAARGEDPNQLVMSVAEEGLRSSLMTWMDVAGPKFAAAMAREREFEEKYGADVDQFMQWLFSAPPSTEAEVAAEEAKFRRAMHADDLAPATM